MALERTHSYLKDSTGVFRYYKNLGENAIAQCPDTGLVALLDDESNSIATIVEHLHGNMVWRWTDCLTTDGEKPTRTRDAACEDQPATRAQILYLWDPGGACE